MTYPPDPNNPYGKPQQPPQAGYGYPQQPGAGPQQQPPYGYPQQGQQQPPYGYPQQDPYAQQQPPPYGQQGQQPFYQQQPFVAINPANQSINAGWLTRVVGYLIDSLIIGVVPIILIIVGVAVAAPSNDSCTYNSTTFETTCSSSGGNGAGWLIFVVGILVMIGMGLWMVYLEGTKGQSLGKKAVNIRLVGEADGMPIGFGMAFVRKLCHVLDGLCCDIGYLWPLWDAKEQTFADKIMHTVVIRSV